MISKSGYSSKRIPPPKNVRISKVVLESSNVPEKLNFWINETLKTFPIGKKNNKRNVPIMRPIRQLGFFQAQAISVPVVSFNTAITSI